MSDREEWGPWIDHNGKSCPVPKGTFVNGIGRDGSDEFWMAMMCVLDPNGEGDAWSWAGREPRYDDVIRYRVRTPMSDALKRLIEAVGAGDEDFIRSDDWIIAWQAFRPEPDEMRSKGTASLLLAAEAYSGSLDAAKALHDALLPGWWWAKEPEPVGGGVQVGHVGHTSGPYFGEADNTARSWLLAILRAYQQVQA